MARTREWPWELSGTTWCFSSTSRLRVRTTSKSIIPAVISVYADRSYSFITKTPPVPVLLKKAVGIAKGSGEPNRDKVGSVTMKQVEEIAKLKMPDLNCDDMEAAKRTVLGTARSMGVQVAE